MQRSVGFDGFNWSNAASNTDGVSLWFNAQELASCYENYRGYGFQLRCLSE
ncbi:hypothetical protein [uncultured Rikenella sp.]|uniref:hypothetical protein n=1 Tax=uncultured Rikenella sp. TaxID=368003 RepID=UPI0025E75A37|nr:hypothetical protein [uncultured Rikenella sp.]